MEKTVIILGAGASASAGAPVMKDFLDAAESIHASGRSAEARGAFDKVFAGLRQLRSTAFKASLDTINLESVFNAFETAELLGTLGSWRDAELDGLTTAMRQVIVKTLHESINQVPPGTESLAQFALQCRVENCLKFITFNYDVLFDTALRSAGAIPGYGSGVASGSGMPNVEVPLLKLHGSMNWFVQNNNRGIVATETTVETNRRNSGRHWVVARQPDRSELEDITPLIVPPSLRKADHHQRLRKVWRDASAALAEAQNIIVVGFSLPPTDEFFKYLFAVGSVGDSRLRRFWVIDLFADEALERRFRSILGRESAERFKMFRIGGDVFFRKLASMAPADLDWRKLAERLTASEMPQV